MAFQYLYCGNWDFKGEMKGIHCFRYDSGFGRLLDNGVCGELCGQSMLAIANGHLLSVCELGTEGHVVSYSIEEDGSLKQISVLDFSSPKLSYIKTDSKGEYAFVSSMSDGSVRMLRINEGGALDCVYETYLTGHSVTPRASCAKVHSVMISHDDRYLAAANLGADEVAIFAVNYEKERLDLKCTMPVDWGKEPRHMAFSPDDRYLYVLTESGNRLYVFGFFEGKLTERASYDTRDPEGGDRSAAADIVVSADGKHIYTTNRGQSNIAHWVVLGSGLLDIEGYYPGGGVSPRGLWLTRDERQIICANDEDGTVAVIERNRTDGSLGNVTASVHVAKAGCVRTI